MPKKSAPTPPTTTLVRPDQNDPYPKLLATMPDLAPAVGPLAQARALARKRLRYLLQTLVTAQGMVARVAARGAVGKLRGDDVDRLVSASSAISSCVISVRNVRQSLDAVAALVPADKAAPADVTNMDGPTFRAYVLEHYGVDLDKLPNDLQREVTHRTFARSVADLDARASVHYLHGGHSACQMSMRHGVPGNWPNGHTWSAEWNDVTCDQCLWWKSQPMCAPPAVESPDAELVTVLTTEAPKDRVHAARTRARRPRRRT